MLFGYFFTAASHKLTRALSKKHNKDFIYQYLENKYFKLCQFIIV